MKINNPAKSIRRAAGLAAAIAAMLLCLFAASCGDGGENGSPDKTGGTETETEQVSGTDVAGENARLADISLYTVVYPSDAGEAVKTMAVNLYKALEVKTGKTIKIKDDWVMPGGNKDNDDYEILIGGTNRSATVNLTGSVLCNDFLIAASGNKIVIFANTEALLGEAVSYFQVTLKKDNGVFIWSGNYLKHGIYALEGMTMLGIEVSKFKIVTPDSPAAIETYAAEVLRSLIAEKSGFILEIIKRSEVAGGNFVDVGIKSDINKDLYSVSSNGGTVSMTAGSPAGMVALVGSFKELLDGIKSAVLDGNQLDFTGKVSDGLAKKYDGAELRIMTSNVLFSDSVSFETPYRMKCLMQTYLTYLPDIIGLQEARNTQLNALLPYLTGEYSAVPFTSEDGGQVYQQILYLADKYTLVEYGFTRFRYKVIPWGVSWAVFQRNTDGKMFAVTNTHNTIVASTYDPGLSNNVEGVQYRISNCKTVLETIGKIRENHPGIAVFSTGDWNSTVTAESLGPMMQSELMKDAMLTASGGADNVTNSGHTIGKVPTEAGNIIDHVFISADAAEAMYHDVIVNDTVINGSDHCPVYADVKFK